MNKCKNLEETQRKNNHLYIEEFQVNKEINSNSNAIGNRREFFKKTIRSISIFLNIKIFGSLLLKNQLAWAKIKASSKVYTKLWVWGINLYLGNGNNSGTTPLPSSLILSGKVKTISLGNVFSICVKDDGTLWGWGANTQGQLGLGDTQNRSSPVRIGTVSIWSDVSAGGDHVLALQTDGSLWAWGANSFGQLGLGNTVPRSIPNRIGSLNNWIKVASGFQHSCALQNDNSLWTWGTNLNGQLGFGTPASVSLPNPVGNLNNWLAVSPGDYHTVAIKTDGTLWAFGKNNYGQIGFGDSHATIVKSSPVQIGSLSSWKEICAGQSFTIALDSNHQLWSWGDNSNGTLGLRDINHRSSPTFVGSGYLKLAKSTPYSQTAMAFGNADGTLWGWGFNSNNSLGIPDAVNRSSPIHVGSLSSLKGMIIGPNHRIGWE